MSRHDPLERLRHVIDDLAREDLGDLLFEARVQARSKVREILVEALAERLLELAAPELQQHGRGGGSPANRDGNRAEREPARARARPESEPDGERSAPDGAEQQEREPQRKQPAAAITGCYVYGVVAADAEIAQLTGIDGVHAVSLIRGESIAAVASAVALDEFGEEALREHLDDLAWLETHARRHEHLLDRVREQATLVPMRLCTIYRDERSVREMLAREHAFLADALERLQGRTEWGVKAYLGARGEQIADAGEDAEIGEELGPGAGYLMRRRVLEERQERSEALVDECCERMHAELAAASVEAKVNPVQLRELSQREDPMVFNGVYLVADASADAFTAVVEALHVELAHEGFELELTGPWPPYNFVNSPAEIGR